jgi:hypothetical protein
MNKGHVCWDGGKLELNYVEETFKEGTSGLTFSDRIQLIGETNEGFGGEEDTRKRTRQVLGHRLLISLGSLQS